jgi:hypothetical protein
MTATAKTSNWNNCNPSMFPYVPARGPVAKRSISMPVLRYFVSVGAVLLALLLIVDWYLPPLSAEGWRDNADRSTIRIHSQHKWPAAVVFDTTLPTIVPPAPTTVAVETPAAKPPREAFAMATEPAPLVKAAEPVKPTKPHVRHTRTARPPAGRVASSDTFAFRPMWAPGW